MPPLPPRPKLENEEAVLSENTLVEQQAGRDNVNRANKRLEEEMEAGRKSVELNQQRFAKRSL